MKGKRETDLALAHARRALRRGDLADAERWSRLVRSWARAADQLEALRRAEAREKRRLASYGRDA